MAVCRWCGCDGYHSEVCEGFVINDPARPADLDLRDGYGNRLVALRFHRGDRVRLVEGLGAVGIVEGWKDRQVLVHWGVNNGREARSWHGRFDLELAAGQD